MIIRSGRRKYNVFAYDVESHNDETSVKLEETSIWLSSFINEESKVDDEDVYDYCIDTWLDKIERLSSGKRKNKGQTRPIKNLMIYIYNLSFEWSFILPVLLKRGFKWTPRIEAESEMVFTSVSTKSVSSVWLAEIKFGKKHGTIILKDLAKIFPGGLRNVAKSFGLPTQKGEIDYKLDRRHYRPTGEDVTAEEKEYCFKDTKILMDILVEMDKKNDKDFWKSTSAAGYACRKMIASGFSSTHRPMKAFRKLYPVLDHEESEFLRQGVAGGITYAPAKYQFREIDCEIGHIDLHQAHPSSAYHHWYPYGKGTYFEGEPKWDTEIKCLRIRVSYSGVRLHSVIKLIGIDIISDYEITVWDFEIPTMYKCYIDLEITYVDGYSYKRRRLPWRQFYKTNYEERAKAKARHDAFWIMYYKLLNNSSYGKLLERGHNEIYENTVDPIDGRIDSRVIQKPQSEFRDGGLYTYLGIGSGIPAHTRVTLVEAALHIGWQWIVYFDTDSIFYIKNDYTVKQANSLNYRDELGGWGVEKSIRRGQFSAPKRYKIEEIQDDGSVEPVYHLAGFNGLSKYQYDELDIIHGIYGIHRVKRVKGGTIVIETTKEIDVQEKYRHIYEEAEKE